MITACLVEIYFSKETLYTAKMAQTDVKAVSADHTFKVSANICIMLQGKWIKLYDALFIILNEKGKPCINSIRFRYSYFIDL